MSELALDDFLAGDGSDGSIGALGWRTGAGTIQPQAGTTNHPGIVGLTTGTAANDSARIHLGRTVSTGVIDVVNLLRWQCCLALAQTTSCVVRVGWGTDVSSSTFGSDGVWWERDTSVGTTWRLVCRSGGSSTVVDSGVSGAVEYVTLAAWRQGTRWRGAVLRPTGAATFVTSAGDEPDGAILNAGIYLETLAASAKSLGVDAWGARYARLHRLHEYL